MDDWDDVFDAGASEFDIAAAEQRQRQDRHWRMGYTDGAAAGREAGLQRGFESGLEQARALAHQYGRLQGFVCSALILATKTLPHDHPEVAALQAVYAEVYDMSAACRATGALRSSQCSAGATCLASLTLCATIVAPKVLLYGTTGLTEGRWGSSQACWRSQRRHQSGLPDKVPTINSTIRASPGYTGTAPVKSAARTSAGARWGRGPMSSRIPKGPGVSAEASRQAMAAQKRAAASHAFGLTVPSSSQARIVASIPIALVVTAQMRVGGIGGCCWVQPAAAHSRTASHSHVAMAGVLAICRARRPGGPSMAQRVGLCVNQCQISATSKACGWDTKQQHLHGVARLACERRAAPSRIPRSRWSLPPQAQYHGPRRIQLVNLLSQVLQGDLELIEESVVDGGQPDIPP
ncbi:uncharacterized protein MONBRDRAFT_10116 [Monosiga brevicollis MX1]|uniref:Essential protein Yae1 N-terminal domain-containing protein n=1 Tax=Monosiga brevicollis TaxID=81824 RepID=A9V596_MONBE|nr:uncharacterized protein MONBRDRAFT_10116 [Monosiga brevicollis MX1]EDQ87238.1 predicted protein [Monosiga brevicollis MX1]|eukprot:XP_001747851.1 hypothetical protein [Monosiga brevicollis MX1]